MVNKIVSLYLKEVDRKFILTLVYLGIKFLKQKSKILKTEEKRRLCLP